MNERRHSRLGHAAILLLIALAAPLLATPRQDRPSDRRDPDRRSDSALDVRPVDPLPDATSWISLDVAPDGRSLVFELSGNLYSLPIAGGTATRITSGIRSDSQPRFSPDGSRIVFLSDRGDGGNIWIARRDGSDARPLTTGTDTHYLSPEWTPDGQFIIVSRSGGVGGSELWLYRVDGTGGASLARADGPRQINPLGPAFGKDPRLVYYTERAIPPRGRDESSFGWQLSMYDRETGENFRMSDERGNALRPVLSPDGHWLVYATRWDAQTGLRVRNLRSGDDAWLIYPVATNDQEFPSTRDLMPGSSFTPDSKALITAFGGVIWRVEVPSGEATAIPFTTRTPAADRR